VITLTEPQVWVLIGVFATAILGMLRWQTVSFNRTLSTAIGAVHAEIGSLRNEMQTEVGGLRNEVQREVGGMRGEMRASIDGLRESTHAKFDLVKVKIDSLDRDVQALTRHVFGTDPR